LSAAPPPRSPATILHAPNVHTGGGLVLLRALLASWPAGARFALLDARAREQLVLPEGVDVRWVDPRAAARLAAERHLRTIAQRGDTVLCFHGLPPLLPSRARVLVFLQNRLYLGINPLSAFKRRTALRLAFERLIGRRLRHHVDAYIVQTPTMAGALRTWHGGAPRVRVLPFVDDWVAPVRSAAPKWDFVYVADGEAHKNHARLYEAWRLLAQTGRRPRLALTLGTARDAALIAQAGALRAECGAEVHNLAGLSREAVLALYADARALIFPSTSESFGLPLIEAARCGLPIVAAELDYVRDVCVPALTFDPLSPPSIAEAVQRFLDAAPRAPGGAARVAIGRPEDFWRRLHDDSEDSDA
jgi:glycosyltransferase involved in cell wall biosynthesis